MQHVGTARTQEKISNGTRLLPADVDMRTARGRRLKFLVRAFHEALGAGDLDEIELGQLRRLAVLTLQAEMLSSDVVKDCGNDRLQRLQTRRGSKDRRSRTCVAAGNRRPGD
jgi:hypothetical protein